MADILTDTTEVGSSRDIFKGLIYTNCQPRVLYPVEKKSFKNEGEIIFFRQIKTERICH